MKRLSNDPRFRAVGDALAFAERAVGRWPALDGEALRVVVRLAQDMLDGDVLGPLGWPAIWTWVSGRAREHGETWARGGWALLEEPAPSAEMLVMAWRRIAEGEAEQAAGWLARVIVGELHGGAGVDVARQAMELSIVAAIEAEECAAHPRGELGAEEVGAAHVRRRALLDDVAACWEQERMRMGGETLTDGGWLEHPGTGRCA
ncbi:hypothetical protein [Polyangium sp. y55x31]|uniref:hypothetical protein n=1 Tax=Polyangium sp. y55x31 TaxID=3042688 RepID=UPI002482D50B|nr:hypothetical protein [Polyangium sp. y55x31]MDI1475404.1 hypothetical protein [Polyangium sp. y55x31]